MIQELFPDGHWRSPAVAIIAVPTCLMTIATVAVALRLYARISLKKKLAADDIFIVVGLGLSIGRTVIAGLSSQSGWASRAGPTASFQIPYYLHYFERRLLYALAAFFIRAGVLTYYLRLFPRALYRLRGTSWVLLVLSFLQCAQLCINIGIYCDDITDLYRHRMEHYDNPHCSDAYGFTYSGAIGDAIVDGLIYITPIPYVWGLRRLRLDQRVGLVFVFGIGSLACVFALLQIPFIIMNYRHRPDGQSWFGSEVSLFIEIELALGLIAASLPDLRGFISRNGFLQSFRHREDSDDVGSVRSPSFAGLESPSDPPRAPSYSIPIIGGVRMGGEGVGWRKKFITPGWLRHDLSLFNTEHSVMTASRRASFEAAKLEDIEASGESSDSANESSEPSPQEGETSREGEKTQHAPG